MTRSRRGPLARLLLSALAVALAALLTLPLTATAGASTGYLTTKAAKRAAVHRIKRDTNRGGSSYVFHELNFCTRYSATLVGCDYYSEEYVRQTDDRLWTVGELMVRLTPRGYHTRTRHQRYGWLSDLNVTQDYWYCWDTGDPDPHHFGYPVTGDHLCSDAELQ